MTVASGRVLLLLGCVLQRALGATQSEVQSESQKAALESGRQARETFDGLRDKDVSYYRTMFVHLVVKGCGQEPPSCSLEDWELRGYDCSPDSCLRDVGRPCKYFAAEDEPEDEWVVPTGCVRLSGDELDGPATPARACESQSCFWKHPKYFEDPRSGYMACRAKSDFDTGECDPQKKRELRYAPEVSLSASQFFVGYRNEVMAFVTVPSVLAGLSGLWFVLFLIGRYVLDMCGGKGPTGDHVFFGYTTAEQLKPCCVFLFFGLAGVVVAGVGLVYNLEFDNGITTLESDLDTTLIDANAFVSAIWDPLLEANSSLAKTVRDASETLDGSVTLEYNNAELVSKIQQFRGGLNEHKYLPAGCLPLTPRASSLQGTMPTNPSTLDSTCLSEGCCQHNTNVALHAGISDILTAVDAKVAEASDSLQTQRQDMKAELVDAPVQAQIADAMQSTRDLLDTTASLRRGNTGLFKEVKSYNDQRKLFVMAAFGASLAVFVLGCLGSALTGVGMKPCVICIHLGWLLAFLVMILGFVTAGLLMPIGVVMSDGCHLVDVWVNSLEACTNQEHAPAMCANSERATRGFDALFNDRSLLDALNISSALGFVGLDLGRNASRDVGDSYTFPELDAFIDEIEADTLDDVGNKLFLDNAQAYVETNLNRLNTEVTTAALEQMTTAGGGDSDRAFVIGEDLIINKAFSYIEKRLEPGGGSAAAAEALALEDELTDMCATPLETPYGEDSLYHGVIQDGEPILDEPPFFRDKTMRPFYKYPGGGENKCSMHRASLGNPSAFPTTFCPCFGYSTDDPAFRMSGDVDVEDPKPDGTPKLGMPWDRAGGAYVGDEWRGANIDDRECMEAISADALVAWERIVNTRQMMRDLVCNNVQRKVSARQLRKFNQFMRETAVDFEDAMVAVGDGSVKVIDKSVQLLRSVDCGPEGQGCGWVRSNYDKIKATFCGVIIGSVFVLAITMFIGSVLKVSDVISLVILSKRLYKGSDAIAPEG